MNNKSSHNEEILLSACLIVKDEQEFLEGCLHSLAGLVHEIVVVDTGSKDQTKDIARRFTGNIYTFSWNDNFSEARNYCVSKARGKWILQIDADERIRPVEYSYLKSLLAEPEVLAYRTLNECLPEYTASHRSFRLYRNDRRIRYTGVIHETVEKSVLSLVRSKGLKVENCDLYFEHLGYINDPQAKHKRDYPLLQKELERDTSNGMNWHRFALIQYHLNYIEEARVSNNTALTILRNQKDSLPPPDGVLLYHLEAYLKTDDEEDVYPILIEGLDHYPHDPVLNYLLARAHIQNGKYSDAIPLFMRLIEQGRNNSFEQAISHPKHVFGEWAYDGLATAHFQMGEWGKAVVYYQNAYECSHNEEYKLKKELCEIRKK